LGNTVSNDTYLLNGTESELINEASNGGNDTLKLVADGSNGFVGSSPLYDSVDKIVIDNFSTKPNAIENIDASAIKSTYLYLYGNDLGNSITGGDAGNYISAGNGNDTITTGDSDDTIFADDGNNFINAGDGNNVICSNNGNNNATVTDGSNQFYLGSGDDTITILGDGNNFIGNNDGNNLITTGNGDNKIYTGSGNDSISAGSGNDTIGAGGGNDTISGGAGFNQYDLHQDDAKDIITSTNANDIINISDVSKADLLFYTDGSGNLFMDYTAGGISSDILDLGTSYNNSTTIQLGALSLDLGTIVASLDSAYKNVADPSLLGTGDKTTQSASLTWADSSGDSTYLIDGSATKKATEELGGGTDTLQLTTTDGSFAGSTHLSINDFSTMSGTLENVDASAITGTDLYIEANNLDNIITGGAGNDTIAGCDFNIDTNGWNTSMGGSGNDSLYGGLGDDTYLLDGTDYVTINDAGGNDTIKLAVYATNGAYAGSTSFTMSNYIGVENIDTSANTSKDVNITSNLAGNHNYITGNSNDTISVTGGNYNISTGNGTDVINASGGDMIITAGDGYKTIYTGAGNDSITTGVCGVPGDYDDVHAGAGKDTIVGGAGDDTITGGLGTNLYGFSHGDGNDLITATSATDNIYIYDWSSSTKMLFYTDATGNLYADYTATGIGTDIVEIAAGQYDSSTTIQLGNNKIYVNDILSQLSVASGTAELDTGGLAALSTANESAQVTALAPYWHT